MANCINHPETPTSRRCALCEQPFCNACLEVVPGAGPICANCELELAEIPEPERTQRLDALREAIQRAIPAPRPWWGWVLMFWMAVAMPSILTGVHLYDLYRYQQFLSFLSREPVLPGVTMSVLTGVSTALERFRLVHGRFPDSLGDLVRGENPSSTAEAAIRDPYSPAGHELRYRHGREGYRLCSIGPDRRDDGGIPLDQFNGRGDLCVGLGAMVP